MSVNYSDALDELFGMVKAIFDQAKWSDLFGYTIDVRWPGVALATKPDMTKLWARVSFQIVSEPQASLSNAAGNKMYETTGLLYVQLFCPRNQPDSMDNGRELAVDMRNRFRHDSPSQEIWFRNQTVRELPETEENYPINVVVTFSYKTLQQGFASIGDGMLRQRLITGVVDGVNRTFIINGNPESLIWHQNGLAMKTPDDFLYVDGVVTTTVPPALDTTLLAIGE
jgi:hypothetical protein